MISERPADAVDHAVPGHWEGDLILGLNRLAIGTLVERTTRFTLLPPMPGHGEAPRVKHGPPLAGHGARAVRDAIAAAMATMPAQLRRSLTWDQGAEIARHADLKIAADLPVDFCDPHSPWQRGTNENTKGLLRQCVPKGADLTLHGKDDIDAVAPALNGRPRQTRDWQTPAEALGPSCSKPKVKPLRRPVETAKFFAGKMVTPAAGRAPGGGVARRQRRRPPARFHMARVAIGRSSVGSGLREPT